ncbi:hypothetical protein BC938DRAFT_476007 [Jimgerdemannia flammicorona]|uniref:Uncharacterized protein n=1 Tax=Jimgerdemannia flammicorona TaxID=994334 RepID=A0A433QR40_9FUNG|nr:hypothetical protein BC938DRAFT_476007 [Jimgerdemannia flammicorona]
MSRASMPCDMYLCRLPIQVLQISICDVTHGGYVYVYTPKPFSIVLTPKPFSMSTSKPDTSADADGDFNERKTHSKAPKSEYENYFNETEISKWSLPDFLEWNLGRITRNKTAQHGAFFALLKRITLDEDNARAKKAQELINDWKVPAFYLFRFCDNDYDTSVHPLSCSVQGPLSPS